MEVSNMNIIVSGSRGYNNQEVVSALIQQTIDRISECVTCIYVGDARGVDACARNWAYLEGHQVKRYVADWSLGRHAGVRRTAQMIGAAAESDCILIAIATPSLDSSPGTAHAVRIAQAAHIPVALYELDGDQATTNHAVIAAAKVARQIEMLKSYPTVDMARLYGAWWATPDWTIDAGLDKLVDDYDSLITPYTTRNDTLEPDRRIGEPTAPRNGGTLPDVESAPRSTHSPDGLSTPLAWALDAIFNLPTVTPPNLDEKA